MSQPIIVPQYGIKILPDTKLITPVNKNTVLGL